MRWSWRKVVYYKQVACLHCEGKGKVEPRSTWSLSGIYGVEYKNALLGICPVCFGTGVKTVVDRVERS